jgi:hypothetical protein
MWNRCGWSFVGWQIAVKFSSFAADVTTATGTARPAAEKKPGDAVCGRAAFAISAVKTAAWTIAIETACIGSADVSA